jgi:DNA-binding Lrp family transcriptional regulator
LVTLMLDAALACWSLLYSARLRYHDENHIYVLWGGRAMQNAVILINTEKGQVKAVAERLADVEGISEVYSTCGRYDLVAIARTRDFESLAELVTERLNAVEGVSDTETLNAMQVHSRHDLETMFSLGW